MPEFVRRLLAADFVPHGYCMRWASDVVWLHVISDSVIAFSYYLIPFALVYFIRKRKDLAYPWMFTLFGLFILACGTSHLMGVWVLWDPRYRLEGFVKAVTAAASLPTAILLIRLVPAAIAIPGPAQWRALNSELQARVEERTRELRALNQELLETNVGLRAANADLEQFAWAASHDLQEPLRMLISYSQLLERRHGRELGEDAKPLLDEIVGNAQRMGRLVSDLREYTLASKDQLDPNGATADVDTALDKALRQANERVKASHAVIEREGLATLPVAPQLLAQVLQNLVVNAIKYRSEAAPHIRVVQEGNRLSVIDNGMGIAPQYREKIFGVFKRLHGREYEGTGIGLALCKRVVERFGGRIWAEGNASGGTTFILEFPQRQNGEKQNA